MCLPLLDARFARRIQCSRVVALSIICINVIARIVGRSERHTGRERGWVGSESGKYRGIISHNIHYALIVLGDQFGKTLHLSDFVVFAMLQHGARNDRIP